VAARTLILAGACLAAAVAATGQVPATQDSIAAGQQLYLRNCASCHGRTGQGGPGNDLIPAAPGLTGDKWDHGSTDQAIFDNIKNGIAPDFNMVPFKDKLKDDEIRSVVAFIRSLEKKK
jgi:mono/diheme cytochrome c family protein